MGEESRSRRRAVDGSRSLRGVKEGRGMAGGDWSPRIRGDRG